MSQLSAEMFKNLIDKSWEELASETLQELSELERLERKAVFVSGYVQAAAHFNAFATIIYTAVQGGKNLVCDEMRNAALASLKAEDGDSDCSCGSRDCCGI